MTRLTSLLEADVDRKSSINSEHLRPAGHFSGAMEGGSKLSPIRFERRAATANEAAAADLTQHAVAIAVANLAFARPRMIKMRA